MPGQGCPHSPTDMPSGCTHGHWAPLPTAHDHGRKKLQSRKRTSPTPTLHNPLDSGQGQAQCSSRGPPCRKCGFILGEANVPIPASLLHACPSASWGSSFPYLLLWATSTPGTGRGPCRGAPLPGSLAPWLLLQAPYLAYSTTGALLSVGLPTPGQPQQVLPLASVRKEPAVSGQACPNHFLAVLLPPAHRLASDLGGLQAGTPGCRRLPQRPQLLFQHLVAAVHVQVASLDLPLVA